MTYIEKRIEKNRQENPEYQKAYDEEVDAMVIHNIEIKDSDGLPGSTLKAEDSKTLIQRWLDELEK